MVSIRPLAMCALLALLVAAGTAQFTPTNLAVGFVTRPTGPTNTGAIHIQDIDGGCQPDQVLCASFGTVTTGMYGGTAYDARYQGVWVAYNNTIELCLLRGCAPLFKFRPAMISSTAQISGLALSERRGMLYHIETEPDYLGIMAYDLTQAPPAPVGKGWTMKLPNLGNTAGGVAYDEEHDRLFVATSFAAFHGYLSELYVIEPATPMRLVTTLPISMVSGTTAPRIVTGLGYDVGTRNLYVTDGYATMTGKLVGDPDLGRFTWPTTACSKSAYGEYVGMAVIPGWRQAVIGSGCTGAPCHHCPAMTIAVTGGDPVLGNQDFSLSLQGAPINTSAFLVLGGGVCTKGLQVPVLCGPLYPALSPPPLLVGPLAITGATQCAGVATARLPIPIMPVLVGVPFCSQWVVACQAPGGVGLGISPALEFTIAGS